MDTSGELSAAAPATSTAHIQERPAATRGELWVTQVSWVWLGAVVVFSIYIAISKAYQASHLNEWGDPTGDLGAGFFGTLYLAFFLPVASLVVLVANVIDLVRNVEMGPVAQVVRMLTIGAAVAAPIITYSVLAP